MNEYIINNNDLKSIKKLLSNNSISEKNKEEVKRLCNKINNHFIFEQLSEELYAYIKEKSNNWQNLLKITYLDDDCQELEAYVECEDDRGPSTFAREKYKYSLNDGVFSFEFVKK